MDKKDKLKINISRLLMTLIVILAMTLLVLFLNRLFMPKNPLIKRGNYYRQEEKTEVLFMGTSHAYAGFVPMELYRKYGISSYCLATSGERFALTYYSLKDALTYQTPKVVVVDVHAFEYGNEKNDPQVTTRCHTVFDYMKLSPIKLEALEDIIGDKSQYMDYLFPLYFYHNRWMELEAKDFKNPVESGYMRGGNLMMGVASPEAFEVIPSSDYSWEDNYSTQYAEKIVEMCADKGIDVLFVCVPFPSDAAAQRNLNQASYIADKYDNCEYIDLLEHTEDMGFDYDIDMADPTSHVNPSGGRKVTDYLGGYLSSKYDFADARQGEKYQENYINFLNYYNTYRSRCGTYLEYLTTLYEPDVSCCVYIRDAEEIRKSDKARKLLEQSGMDISGIDQADKCYACSDFDGQKQQFTQGEAIEETSFPKEALDRVDPDAAISIAVINNYTGELMDVTNWSTDTESDSNGDENNLAE